MNLARLFAAAKALALAFVPTVKAITYTPSGTTTISLGGTVGKYTATAATGGTTWVFSGAPPSGVVGVFILDLSNGGSQTQTWPAAVKWPGGVAPSLTAAGRDRLVFETSDNGTTWSGSASLDIK